MKVLIDEDSRVLSVIGDMDILSELPDDRWRFIDVNEDVVLEGDNIDNRWNGNKFVYDPKKY